MTVRSWLAAFKLRRDFPFGVGPFAKLCEAVLTKSCSWNCVCNAGFESAEEVTLDHVWTAMRFCKKEEAKPQRAVVRKREAAMV
jgi:hypothetical protein